MGMTQQQIIDQNNQFLALVDWKPGVMDSVNNTYALGKTLKFTFSPTGGYAKAIWVFGVVDVDVTLGTNAVLTLSDANFYALFRQMRVKLGNTIHQVHPWAVELINRLSNNAGQEFNYAGPNAYPWASQYLFGSNNGATKSNSFLLTAGDNIWRFGFRIPLQFEPGDVTGLIPLGSSANQLTLEFDTAQQIGGSVGTSITDYYTDPLYNAAIVTTPGTTATTIVVGTSVSSTINAVVEYADMNTLQGPSAVVQVPDPIITQAIYLRDNTTAVTNFGQYTYARFDEPYEFMRLIAIMDDNYTSSNDANNPAQLANVQKIDGIKLNFDGQETAMEWGADTGGTFPFWFDQIRKYGNNLPQGVLPFDFSSGQDPRHPSGQNLLNAKEYTQARIGIQYANPSGGTAPSGSYIKLIGQYIVPQAY